MVQAPVSQHNSLCIEVNWAIRVGASPFPILFNHPKYFIEWHRHPPLSDMDPEKVNPQPRGVYHPTSPGTGIELARREHRSLEHTNSMSLGGGPTPVDPSARLPGDFRTLR